MPHPIRPILASRVVPLAVTLAAVLAAGLLVVQQPARAATTAGTGTDPKATVVLVHGAFAESASWNGVTERLQKQGYRVVAAANPLRGVASDGAYVRNVLESIQGPIVLVGHSYGGPVISNAAVGVAQVKALVFVAAFAPDLGETAIELTGRFPGATLGTTLSPPVALATGGKDLYIDQGRFPAQFAADVPLPQARLMAATQRPIQASALEERAGEPAWKQRPSWFIYGDADKNIPAEAHRFMAQRASSRKTIVVKGASHVVMTSNPDAVARLIADAASAD